MSALAVVPVSGAQSQPDALSALVRQVVSILPSKHSQRAYGSTLRRFLAWSDGRTFCRSLVTAYLAELRDAGAGSSSLNTSLAGIKALAREAMAQGVLPEPVAAAVIQIRGERRKYRRVGKWLSVEETRRLLSTAQGNLRDQALLAVLISTGLRRAELCSLRRHQVQQRECRWCLCDVVRKGNRVGIAPLPEWASKRLLEWQEVNQDDRVFPLSEAGISYVIKRRSREIGAEITPHDGRRTAAGLAIKGGASLTKVQEMLAHANASTTSKYIKTMVDLQDCACDMILAGEIAATAEPPRK